MVSRNAFKGGHRAMLLELARVLRKQSKMLKGIGGRPVRVLRSVPTT